MSSGLLGGIITPMMPAQVTMATLNVLLYPRSTMAGMVMHPMAATVAGPEPLMAAKNMQVAMVARARPPVLSPKKASASLRSLLLRPPSPMNTPVAMKKGMAMMAELSMLV